MKSLKILNKIKRFFHVLTCRICFSIEIGSLIHKWRLRLHDIGKYLCRKIMRSPDLRCSGYEWSKKCLKCRINRLFRIGRLPMASQHDHIKPITRKGRKAGKSRADFEEFKATAVDEMHERKHDGLGITIEMIDFAAFADQAILNGEDNGSEPIGLASRLKSQEEKPNDSSSSGDSNLKVTVSVNDDPLIKALKKLEKALEKTQESMVVLSKHKKKKKLNIKAWIGNIKGGGNDAS